MTSVLYVDVETMTVTVKRRQLSLLFTTVEMSRVKCVILSGFHT